MPTPLDASELDAIADVVIARLRGPDRPLPGLPDQVPLVPERPQLPDLLPRRRLGVAGIELTQVIQHHGAAGQSYGVDNGVPLVALKTLVARVYPWATRGTTLTGAATVGRVSARMIVSSAARPEAKANPRSPSSTPASAPSSAVRVGFAERLYS